MKNRVKGAFLTLLMLFATLYPSGKAYANGLPPENLKVERMSLSEKQILTNELVNDKEFLNFYKSSMFITLLFLVKSKNSKQILA